jgi:proline iminopeptidase
MDMRRLLSDLVSAPQYSLADDLGYVRGQLFSLEILLPEMRKVDLTQLGSDFQVPIFFFEGRFDPFARPSLIWAYYPTIQAQHKDFVWFEKSGHFPFFEEKQEFTGELVRRLLPLASPTDQ